MLRALIHRLTLTGLLMTSFVGTGLFFGGAPADLNAAENEANIAEIAAKTAEAAGSAAQSERRRPDLGWPFFTFGKKRSAVAW